MSIVIGPILKVVKTTAIVEINGKEIAVPTSMKGYRYHPGLGDVVRVRTYKDGIDIQRGNVIGIHTLVSGRLKQCLKRT